MTMVVLGLITVAAAAVLLGVLWSVGAALRAESSSARLRREGVRVTGTVVDNTMTSTPQRRLLFSPVVEFHSLGGARVTAAAQQQAASSWARGTAVDVCYDPVDPHRFVLAGPPARGHLIANVVVGLLVVTIMLGTIVAMYRVWSEFRYDRSGRPINDGIGHSAPRDVG
jgi:Protein of unknown function (DUF3592)